MSPWGIRVGGGGGGGGGGAVTVTSKNATPCSPPESVAAHLTVVVPTGNCESDGGLQIGVGATASSRSKAVTVNVTFAPPGPMAWTEKLAGTVTVGAVFVGAARTVTVNDALPTFRALSVALQVTVVVSPGG